MVLLSYPAPCFGIPKALRIFVSTNAALSTQEILRLYTQRWHIELIFRQSKKKLGLDKYQLRSQKESRTTGWWYHLSIICVALAKELIAFFDEGYAYMQQELKAEHLKNLFQVIKSGATFEEVLEIAG